MVKSLVGLERKNNTSPLISRCNEGSLSDSLLPATPHPYRYRISSLFTPRLLMQSALSREDTALKRCRQFTLSLGSYWLGGGQNLIRV